MNKRYRTGSEYESETDSRLVRALIDCEIENAKLAQKYERLMAQAPVSMVELSDPDRHKMIYSLTSHNPPHLEKPKRKFSKRLLSNGGRRLIVFYILLFIIVYYGVGLIG